MGRKRVGELSWVDAAVKEVTAGRRDKLSEISQLLNWSAIERLLDGIHASARGEAAYPPVVMFKVLLLQRWYSLSDPAMEEALADRLSFRRFVGLSLEDETPDHSTIWRFREELSRRGLIEPLMDEMVGQLDDRGLLLKQGTLIDATLVQGAARRPRKKEGKTSRTDPKARFGTNNERRRFEFGYKGHVAVDGGSALVRAVRMTPANIQEIDVAVELVQGDELALYADRGYDAEHLHAHLAALGIADGIMRRNRKGRLLSDRDVARNHALAGRRRPVEKVFGTLKRSYRLARLPYFNRARNTVAFALACFAYNLRRVHALTTP